MTIQKQQIEAVSQFFKSLGDPTRLRILVELTEKNRTVSTMVKKLKVAQPTLSHHLGLLRMGGVVDTEAKREGNLFYSIPPKHGKTMRAHPG